MKWQINPELKIVFTVVYKEILQLAFVDQFIDMLQKAFMAGVYEKALTGEPGLLRDDFFLRLIANQDTMFGPHYKIVYDKWDSLVKKEQTAPKKMRSFAETQKGKKLGKKGNKGGQQSTTAIEGGKEPSQPHENTSEPGDTSESPIKGEGQDDDVLLARANLKKRFQRSNSTKNAPTLPVNEEEKTEDFAPTRPHRNWVTVTDKVDAKAMAKVNVNDDESASQMNLEAEMEKYLGGDDEVLKGFYDSDEEVQFDSINPDSQASNANQSMFSRITSAFQSIAGNKVLTREDMEPLLAKFAQNLMDKNVNQEVANDICRQVEAGLMDSRTRSFTSVNATIKTSLE